MRKFITSLKKWQIVALTIVLMIIIIMSAKWFISLHIPEEKRDDYKVVAENFIKKSGFIANKLGKATNISHIGKGGSSGKKSYNVYKVRGKDASGIINLTLTRDSERRWFVTYADLATGGKVFTVPIKRSKGEKWREFKLR